MAPSCIKVNAPAHLHAGNIDLNGELGRVYGTVGFTIDRPSVVVKIEKASSIEANDIYAKRFTEILVRSFGLEGARITVERSFYAYAGLGYITSLCFAIGVGLSYIYNLGLSIEDIALTVKRGLVTALGLYSCKYGGFIVEGGFRRDMKDSMVPPLVYRGDIPEDWLFVVAVPIGLIKRNVEFRERYEGEILGRVYMDSSTASYLSRLVLMKIIPSFVERDIEEFGKALTEFNRRLGYTWSEYQGGVYSSPIVEKGIEIMLKYAYGACQSSWGPTFYGITDDERKARALVDELKAFLDGYGGGDVFIARGRNKGLEMMSCG